LSVRALAKSPTKSEKPFGNPIDSAAINAATAIKAPRDEDISVEGTEMILITTHVSMALHFWALTFTTAYSVLLFVGCLAVVYASPSVDQTIRAPEPAIDEDAQKKRAALVPFIPHRAKMPVEDQGLDWAA
jgi:hypothetical protein